MDHLWHYCGAIRRDREREGELGATTRLGRSDGLRARPVTGLHTPEHLLLGTEQHFFARVLGDDVHHDGEAHFGRLAVDAGRMQGDLHVTHVAKVVAAGGDYTGEAVVEALAGQGLRQSQGLKLLSLRRTDERDRGARVIVDDFGSAKSVRSSKLRLEVLARRGPAEHSKDACRQLAEDRTSLGVARGSLQVHLLHLRHSGVVGSIGEGQGLHQRVNVDGSSGGRRGNLSHHRTGCGWVGRAVGSLVVGVVALGAVRLGDPPRTVDDALLLLDVAPPVTAVALDVLDHDAIEAGNRFRIAALTAWTLGAALAFAVATLALAVLALASASYSSSLSVASTLAVALLRDVDAELLQLPGSVGVAGLLTSFELSGQGADLIPTEVGVEAGAQQLLAALRVLDERLDIRA